MDSRIGYPRTRTLRNVVVLEHLTDRTTFSRGPGLCNLIGYSMMLTLLRVGW